MRSILTHFVLLACALFIICACCVSPVSAQATTDPLVTVGPASDAPSTDLQSVTTAPTEETPQEKKKGRLVLVPAFNLYYPSDSKTQSRFGDSWPSIGISVAWRDQPMDPRKVELRLDGMGRSGDGRKALVFPLGIGVSQRLSSSKNLVTYAGLSANAYFGKVVSDLDGVNTGWKIKAGPGAFLGANIGSRFNVQASYYVVPSLGGFGLSGFNLSAHVQLF